MNDKLIEALKDFEGKLEGWAAAYPLTIFREPSDEELKNAHEALKTVGLTLDVLSASAMRYVATSLAAHFLPVREALAASKQEPLEKLTRLTEEMGLYPWQEPQAQAGEPKIVAVVEENALGNGIPEIRNLLSFVSIGDELITLQSHREVMADVYKNTHELVGQKIELLEAIAKKDAALKAYEDQNAELKSSLVRWREKQWPGTDQSAVVERDYPAITQAKEARK